MSSPSDVPVVDNVQPEDSASQVGSTAAFSGVSMTSKGGCKAKLAKLKIQQETLFREQEIAIQQQKLQFEMAKLQLQEQLALTEAEYNVYEEEEIGRQETSTDEVHIQPVPEISKVAQGAETNNKGQMTAHQHTPRRPSSEVILHTMQECRLPQVPIDLPSTVSAPAKRIHQGAEDDKSRRRDESPIIVRRRRLLPDVRVKERCWGMKVPGSQSLPTAGPGSTDSKSSESPITENRLLQLVGALQGPRIVIEPFDGNPVNYPSFMRTFKESVEAVMPSSRARLTRLMQLCTGKAALALRGCGMMSSENGYQRAKEILKERFGKPVKITQLIIRQLMEEKETSDLQAYADQLENAYMSLKEVGAEAELNAQGVLKPLVKRLSRDLRQKWRTKVYGIEEAEERSAGLRDLVGLLRRVAATEEHPVYGEDSWDDDGCERAMNSMMRSQKEARKSNATFAIKRSLRCLVCEAEGHRTMKCRKFAAYEPEVRMKEAIRLRLCFVCLEAGHMTRDCHQKIRCRVEGCGRMHASLLHDADWNGLRKGGERIKVAPTRASTNGEVSLNEAGQLGTSYCVKGSKIALPLVYVMVSSPESSCTVQTYALLDSGSNVTLCDEQLLRDLGVSGRKEALRLTTLEKAESEALTEVVSLTVRGQGMNTTIHLPRVFSRRSLNLKGDSLVTGEEIDRWPHLKGLPIPRARALDVKLLIGQDCSQALAPMSTVLGGKGEPFAVRTCLGWTVNGPVTAEGKSMNPMACSTKVAVLNRLSEQISEFWKLESGGVFDRARDMSDNDKMVMQRWTKEAKYKNGRYTLPIPFKLELPAFPDNRQMAEKRLASLRNRLQRNESLRKKYGEGMEDLLAKGYATRVPEKEQMRTDGKVWYLPHHPVINPNKEKPRIVFDCAAEYRGVSLNNQVHQGPDLTNGLIGVLLRFRLHPVAVMADVEAMFHQVKVDPEDRDVLRFLWWPDGDTNRQPAAFRMTSHLFGGTWSPSCCTYALRRTVEDHGQSYSSAVRSTALRNFYVDDCLKSVPTENEAIDLACQLTSLLYKGGFNLTKWTANRPAVLDSIPQESRSKKVAEREFNSPLEDRALGVYWNVDQDCLGFRVVQSDKPATKRGMLSVLSSVYDPLGLVGPFVLRARKIVQDLCRKGVDWDQPVAKEHQTKWHKWTKELSQVTKFGVPRCVQVPRAVMRQLHHFSDASANAYGVASYLCTEDSEGNVMSKIVMAKSRLAPIKSITIPRLELQAAVLATRQDALLKRELDVAVQKTIYWTDSTIVLQYIRNPEARYHVFVANRVSEIREKTNVDDWRYVPTSENPADDASRGVPVAGLSKSRWLQGPAFLKMPSSKWPADKSLGPLPSDDPEVKKVQSITLAACEKIIDNPLETLISYYSSWRRLLRAIACFLLIPEVLLRKVPKVDMLRTEHIKNAEKALVIYLQRKYYSKELEALSKERRIPADSPLRRLQLGLREGVMTINGRLTRAVIPEEAKHPAVLPANHPAVQSLIREIHERTAHSGREYILAELRQRFWVIGANSLAKRIISRCIVCKRRDAQPCTQKEADLPEDRVRPEEPAFCNVGVDYFGPISVKRGRGTEKRYGCLFTCLATRAVHLELAAALDTDSFLNCLYRFMARRGQPELIRSDNGRNFVGADRELRKALQAWNQEKIHHELGSRRITWLFNPPAASHMGGVWERQIRTVKKVLAGLVTEQVLTHDSLETLLIIAEGIVNNRPLTTVSSDPRDLEPLTPNHILLNRPAMSPPCDLEEGGSIRRKWKQVQYLAGLFWRRWTKEYLPSLRRRTKWQNPKRNIAVDDLVLVIEPQLPRNKWMLGRVIEALAGQDGLVRTAKIKTREGEIMRPIQKLCLLEGSSNDD